MSVARWTGVVALAAIGAVLATPSAADTVADFYRGKVVRMIVGGAAGSGYDLAARMLADHMGRYIPGHPNLIVENMPGAASLVMCNYLYNRGPRDGTAMGLPNSSVPLEPRLHILSRGGGEVHFDIGKFNWIGTPVQEPQVFWTTTGSAFQKFDDLKHNPFVAGATSIGADHYTLPTMMNALLGTHIKIITGYHGPADFFVTAEHGEINGAISAYSEIYGRSIVHVLVQFGSERLAALPDAPTAIELAPTDAAREMFSFYALKFKMPRAVILPPEVPAERVEAMRQAFDATVKDPQFIAEAKKLGFEVDPIDGAGLTRLINRIEETPQPIIDELRAIIEPSHAN